MKKKIFQKKILLLIVCITAYVCQLRGQDVSMHTQGVMQQEFLNPAYNSFKDYVDIGVYNRALWGSKFEYSPKSYVFNLFLPINKKHLGTNLGIIVEDIGLRKTTEFKLSLSHNLRVSQNGYLALGYSVGFLQNSFDREKIISYPDEDLSFLLNQRDLNSLYPTVSIGLLFLSRKWFAGISSMTSSIKENGSDSQYLPGFDFSCGAMFRLSPYLKLRPGVIVKYYNEKITKSENGVIIHNYQIPAVYDFSANLLVFNKFWVGTSHRLEQAQTFSLDVMITPNLKMGYTFELGIGHGLNQFNSHGLRLSYLLKHGKDKKDKQIKDGLDIWPDYIYQSKMPEEITQLIY